MKDTTNKPQPLTEPRPPGCICCEYMRVCDKDRDNGQKIDYCPDPKYREWLELSIPQPLDDEGLREKIHTMILSDKWYKSGIEGKQAQILALLQPKIEEAKREEQRRMTKALRALHEKGWTLSDVIEAEDTMGED